MKKYAVVSGRASRSEYWFFFLFNLIFSVVAGIVDGMLGTMDLETGLGTVGLVYALLVCIPSLAVVVRRLHDTGRTGWWILILLVPLIGVIVLLVFMILDSNEGENQYGPNPKGKLPA